MQAENLRHMALREAGELACLPEAFRDQAALGGVGGVHAVASAWAEAFRSSQTKVTVSSIERGALVVSSMKMLTSFGIVAPISTDRIVVATGQTLLSNLGRLSIGRVAPVSRGHSSPLSAWIWPMIAISFCFSVAGSMSLSFADTW